MKIYEDSFWGRVKGLAWQNGISLKVLAEKAQVPYVTMTNQITKGAIPKKAGVKESLAAVLGTTVEYLVKGDENEAIIADKAQYGPEILNLIDSYRLIDRAKQRALMLVLDAFVEKQREEDREEARRLGTEL